MFRLSLPLGRIAGIPVRVHASFLLLLGVLALVSSGLSFLFVLALAFGSVLLHELGHALVARRRGVHVQEIELHFFGGAAKMTMPRNARDELVIAAAGPAVSFALAAAAYAATTAVAWPVFAMLVKINLGIALFNLIPAFPLDGGRILRAILTQRWGFAIGTDKAVTVSRVLSVALGLAGLWLGWFQLTLIAAFVWMLAGVERRAAFNAGPPDVELLSRQPQRLGAWASPRRESVFGRFRVTRTGDGFRLDPL